MYGITLDRSSPLPLVRQLCDTLRTRILDGSIPANTKLLSSRAASTELGIARNIVLESYEQLEAEGYLSGITGSGTRVTALADMLIKSSNRNVRDEDKLEKKASPVKIEDVPLIDFATACGTPDIESFPYRNWKRCVASALETASYRDLSFTDVHGDLVLRQELASLLFRTRGIRCETEQLFITRGITHALSLTAQFIRKRTALAILEDPLINSFKRILLSAGYELSYIPVDESGLCAEQIPSGREPFLSIVSPSHQFPSGGILPISRRLELLERTQNAGGWIFEDDYDGELRLRGIPIPPIQTLDPDRVFYSGTFNKTLYPAIRLGFLIVPKPVTGAFATFRLGLSDWMESFTGRALAFFVRDGMYERHIWNLKKIYIARRDTVDSELERLFGDSVSIHGTEAGCHCRIHFCDPRYESVDWRKATREGIKIATVARYLSGVQTDPATMKLRNDIILGYGNLDGEAIRTGIAGLYRFLN